MLTARGSVAGLRRRSKTATQHATRAGLCAGTAFDLPNTAFQETGLGDLVTDSYLAAANALPGPHADLAIEASGNIRVPLMKGKTGALAFSDVFNVVPLGLGPDKKPGYPLAAVYLTAKDIMNGLVLSTAAGYQPACDPSGLRAQLGPKRTDLWRTQAVSPDPSGTLNSVTLLCKSAKRFGPNTGSNPAGVAES